MTHRHRCTVGCDFDLCGKCMAVGGGAAHHTTPCNHPNTPDDSPLMNGTQIRLGAGMARFLIMSVAEPRGAM